MKRIVYGATCSWWGTIDKAGKTVGGLPGCPICLGPLYEMTESEWWAGVDRKVGVDDPLYREFIEWLRGRCHRGPNYFETARGIFEVERSEHATRVAEAAAESFDHGRPGLSPYKSMDLNGVRQLAAHHISSSALHVSLDTVPLTGKGDRERFTFVLDLDACQEFIDVLCTGLERAIADSEYGLREA